MITLFAFLAVAVAVGAFAQKKKRRTGALWGFLTLIVQAVAWYVATIAGGLAGDPANYANMTAEEIALANDLAANTLAGGFTLIVMLAIVATLPDRPAD